MADIIRCSSGHFYDKEKNPECPYCKKLAGSREKNKVLFANAQMDWAGENPFSAGETQAQSQEEEDRTIAMKPGQDVMLGDPSGALPGVSMEGEGVTVALFSKAKGTDYVTGWLVGRSGPVKGRDYRIGHGRNWIGRNFNSDIVISEARDIAMKGHCAIVYDDKSVRFFLVPGNGSVQTYLNEEVVTEPMELKTGDMIKLGTNVFDFVSYCREGHIWVEEEQ